MKIVQAIAAVIGSIVILSGCTKDPQLEVSKGSLVLGPDVTQTSIEITSNSSWSISSSTSWLKFSPSSGNGNAQVTITVEPNNEAQSRRGSFQISCGGLVKEISVVQDCKSYSFRITHNMTFFSLPGFNGKYVADWGSYGEDGICPEDAESCTYTEDGPHTVTISCTGNTFLIIEDLSGISEIDLTNF